MDIGNLEGPHTLQEIRRVKEEKIASRVEIKIFILKFRQTGILKYPFAFCIYKTSPNIYSTLRACLQTKSTESS